MDAKLPLNTDLICQMTFELSFTAYVSHDYWAGYTTSAYHVQLLHMPDEDQGLFSRFHHCLKLITNDRFISATHRVLSNSPGPRISVATFFAPRNSIGNAPIIYGPIKELCKENPPIYKEITVGEFYKLCFSDRLNGTSSLQHLRL
ncbi:1-aminocyclopropane-1-carboxylate oxidase homolog 12-like [Tripterygium wilfordii]|uniref:1-aminocyclopropane-1-carboxylate oxidase homolog 12-like n=1 Tax=Tripterygium wilfordii TaxID=458696 RepID=UPI0018F7F284|nr:1-aminocyclopropane-1-carboxylate oxidase homolog 12-like [Tripterygium wilfordii]